MDVPNLIFKQCPTPNKGRPTYLLKKSRDRNDQVGGHVPYKKIFLVIRLFIMIFLKFKKKSLLVDLLTFIAIKNNIMMYT